MHFSTPSKKSFAVDAAAHTAATAALSAWHPSRNIPPGVVSRKGVAYRTPVTIAFASCRMHRMKEYLSFHRLDPGASPSQVGKYSIKSSGGALSGGRVEEVSGRELVRACVRGTRLKKRLMHHKFVHKPRGQLNACLRRRWLRCGSAIWSSDGSKEPCSRVRMGQRQGRQRWPSTSRMSSISLVEVGVSAGCQTSSEWRS